MADGFVIKEKVGHVLGLTVLGIASLAGLMAALRWVTTIWHYKAIGVDNTDEGYYLSAVLFPHQIPHAPTDFAFYLRPLWILSGQNLPAYRVVGFLLIVAVSTVLAFELQRWVEISRRELRVLFVALTSASLVGALAYQYVLWIPTPNYNLLGLCVLALASSSLLAIVRHQTNEVSRDPSTPRFHWSSESWTGLVLFTVFATRVTAGLILGVVFLFFFLQRGMLQRWRSVLENFILGIVAGILIHSVLTLAIDAELDSITRIVPTKERSLQQGPLGIRLLHLTRSSMVSVGRDTHSRNQSGKTLCSQRPHKANYRTSPRYIDFYAYVVLASIWWNSCSTEHCWMVVVETRHLRANALIFDS